MPVIMMTKGYQKTDMAMKTAALRGAAAHHPWPATMQWLQRHRFLLDVCGAVVVGSLLLSVAAQLLYPTDRSLPFLQMGGLDVGGKDYQALTVQFSDYAENGEVAIVSPSRQWRAKWQSIGLSVDPDASAQAAVTYEWWERLIPFSSVVRIHQSQGLPLIALADNERLDAFAAKLVQEDKAAAKDAVIKVDGDEVIIDQAKAGYAFKEMDVKRQIQALAVTNHTELRLVPDTVPFTRSAEELAQLKTEAEAWLAHTPSIKVGDKVYQPTRGTMGGWLQFVEDPATKKMQLRLNSDVVKGYLVQVDKESAIAPGASVVTLLDGIEISRTPAAPGRTVSMDSSVAALEAALQKPEKAPVVILTTTNVPPTLSYVRTYSQGSEGLMAIIRDWDNAYRGDFGVIVREIGGQNRYAESQPDKQFVTASTFKLFVYYAVAKKIEAGEVRYDQHTDMGWSVEACLEEMIVRSTNPCAVSLLNLVGWEWTQDMAVAAGFTSTYLNNRTSGEKYSTVRDESNYIVRLNAGTLMAEEPTARLLGYLKRQIWRAGIPSGVPKGTVVADKVGFYNGWVHDIAVVYGPRSTYILAIMSKGGSDPMFADLSRRVYNFFQN